MVAHHCTIGFSSHVDTLRPFRPRRDSVRVRNEAQLASRHRLWTTWRHARLERGETRCVEDSWRSGRRAFSRHLGSMFVEQNREAVERRDQAEDQCPMSNELLAVARTLREVPAVRGFRNSCQRLQGAHAHLDGVSRFGRPGLLRRRMRQRSVQEARSCYLSVAHPRGSVGVVPVRLESFFERSSLKLH